MEKITRLFLVLLLSISLFFCLSDIAQAKGRGSYGGYTSYKSYRSPSLKTYKSPSLKSYKSKTFKTYYPKTYYPKNYRKSSLSISSLSDKPKRSAAKKKEFLKSRGYEENPHGQEVDHIIPLSKGGVDEPYNMQLLPKEMHKQKTKMEQSNKNI
jgi:5-methylcytosine-specific restriction endonuclease McrA